MAVSGSVEGNKDVYERQNLEFTILHSDEPGHGYVLIAVCVSNKMDRFSCDHLKTHRCSVCVRYGSGQCVTER